MFKNVPAKAPKRRGRMMEPETIAIDGYVAEICGSKKLKLNLAVPIFVFWGHHYKYVNRFFILYCT